MRRLDDVLAIDGEHVFIKIDVEGMAGSVISGMPCLLTNTKGLIQVEISEAERGVEADLGQYGWKLINKIGGDWYFSKDYHGNTDFLG